MVVQADVTRQRREACVVVLDVVGFHVHTMYMRLRHKHLKLDQRKIDFAKRYFGVSSEQEAIDKALSLLMEEEEIVRRLRPLRGLLKNDRRPWPYL